jgi:hypothetical protein
VKPAPKSTLPARLILTAAATAIGGAVAWWHWRGAWTAMLAIVTGALLILAVAAPRAYLPVFRVLEGVVRGLLQSFTWLVLGLVFGLVFIPGRVVLALRRRDPLGRRPDPSRASYWQSVARSTKSAVAHFRAQF